MSAVYCGARRGFLSSAAVRGGGLGTSFERGKLHVGPWRGLLPQDRRRRIFQLQGQSWGLGDLDSYVCQSSTTLERLRVLVSALCHSAQNEVKIF